MLIKSMTAEDKFERLKKNLKKMERVIVAFSGGVDSTFLLKAASVAGLHDGCFRESA
jgi:PP-loop superfamily ATP-utilizing enzyme